jgi:hypothetical protein
MRLVTIGLLLEEPHEESKLPRMTSNNPIEDVSGLMEDRGTATVEVELSNVRSGVVPNTCIFSEGETS